MINSTKYIVLAVLTFCQLLVLSAVSLSQENHGGGSEQPVQLNIKIAESTVCREDGIQVIAKITNKGRDPLAFYPDAIWSRLTFLASSVIKAGSGRSGVFMTTGHSFNRQNGESAYRVLAAGKSQEFSKHLPLTNDFFDNSREYVLKIRYYNVEPGDEGITSEFLNEVESNKVNFNLQQTCISADR